MSMVRGCSNRSDTISWYYFAKHNGQYHLDLESYDTQNGICTRISLNRAALLGEVDVRVGEANAGDIPEVSAASVALRTYRDD